MCLSCQKKKEKKRKKDENRLKNSTSNYLPLSRYFGFYPLVHRKNSSIHYITGMASNVLFTRVENDSNTSRVIASSKAFWFPLDNLEDIFNWVEIQTMCWYGKLSCPNLVPNSSGFYTIFLWVIILQEQLPPWVGRFFKHASKVFTNKRWELLCINSTMILFSCN